MSDIKKLIISVIAFASLIITCISSLIETSYAANIVPFASYPYFSAYTFITPSQRTDIQPNISSSPYYRSGVISNTTSLSSVIGLPVTISSGSTVQVSWSGFTVVTPRRDVNTGTTYPNGFWTDLVQGNNQTTSYSYTYSIRDQDGNMLASVSSTSGTVSFVAPSDLTFIGFSVDYVIAGNNYSKTFYTGVLDADFTVISTTISGQLQQIITTLDSILEALQSFDLSSIVDELQSIKDMITSSPSQDQAAQEVLEKVEEILDQIDELNQMINDNTNRPPPDEIIPSSPPQLLPPTDSAGMIGFDFTKSFLEQPLILSILVMVFTLALIRYVLFGKAE